MRAGFLVAVVNLIFVASRESQYVEDATMSCTNYSTSNFVNIHARLYVPFWLAGQLYTEETLCKKINCE